MPAYNCDKFVAKAIESILNQTYSNFELLIADDCSSDNTKQVIDSFKDQRIKRFHNQTNQGYLKASNLLFGKCQGEFITFQDADDFSEPKRLEKLHEVLSKNTEIGCCYSNVFIIDENERIERRTFYPSTFEEIYSGVITKVVFCGAAIMIKKGILEKVGYYDPYFDRLGNEDKQWFGRILEVTQAICLNEPLYYYRMNQNSVSRTRTNIKAYISEDVAKQYIVYLRKYKIDFINNELYRTKLNQYERERIAVYKMKNTSLSKAIIVFMSQLVKIKLSKEFVRESISLLKFKATKGKMEGIAN
jgi:glycosyltransferase involved in cell wall biosynthesis